MKYSGWVSVLQRCDVTAERAGRRMYLCVLFKTARLRYVSTCFGILLYALRLISVMNKLFVENNKREWIHFVTKTYLSSVVFYSFNGNGKRFHVRSSARRISKGWIQILARVLEYRVRYIYLCISDTHYTES